MFCISPLFKRHHRNNALIRTSISSRNNIELKNGISQFHVVSMLFYVRFHMLFAMRIHYTYLYIPFITKDIRGGAYEMHTTKNN